jgi:hypothetical protein
VEKNCGCAERIRVRERTVELDWIGYEEEGMLETDKGPEATYNYTPGYSCNDTSGEKLGLAILPRHTKVLVTGNNRTKSVLLGLHDVVKKAVGLGG